MVVFEGGRINRDDKQIRNAIFQRSVQAMDHIQEIETMTFSHKNF
jgi:hypothetical protein